MTCTTIKSLSTGLPFVDALTGIGGYPVGRLTQVDVFNPSRRKEMIDAALRSARDAGLRAVVVGPGSAVDVDDHYHVANTSTGVLGVATDLLHDGFGLVIVERIDALVLTDCILAGAKREVALLHKLNVDLRSVVEASRSNDAATVFFTGEYLPSSYWHRDREKWRLEHPRREASLVLTVLDDGVRAKKNKFAKSGPLVRWEVSNG